MLRKSSALVAKLVAVLALFTAPALANHIDSANASVGCSSYTISLAASALAQGQSYTIDFSIILTPSSGPGITISGTTGSFLANPSGTFSATITNPLGPLTGNFTLSGSATLVGLNTIPILFSPTNSLGCQPPPPPCSTPTSNVSNFNGTTINGGSFIWFNANFSASGIPSTGATIFFQSSTIQFTTSTQTFNLTVPNAQITFSPNATCASTTFDTLTNTWMTTVPVTSCDEIFLTGLTFPVPGNFGGKANGNVTWNGSFSSNVSGVSADWKWGAAVYSTFTTDYNALAVKPSHCATCAGYNGGDHAGTPEGTDTATGQPFKKYVIGGARGGGGSNFTGSWSGTVKVSPICKIPD
jgi:hypothetical protein